MSEYLPARKGDPSDGLSDMELISAIAMDIGKSTVEHIEIMYPAALDAVAKTARLSIKNHIFNEIMAALKTTNADEIRQRLAERKLDRRHRLSVYRTIRKKAAKP